MKERPILFSAPMVRALLDSSKTQTCRVVKPQPGDYWNPLVGLYNPLVIENGGYEAPGPEIFGASDETEGRKCLYGQPGDRIWVRETWRSTGDGGRADYMAPRNMQPHQVWYDADGAAPASECAGKTRTSIHMPRWASRILLEVVSVRVERLQDICDADVETEGVECSIIEGRYNCAGKNIMPWRDKWRALWESTGGDWDANPWCWVITFDRVAP